MMNNITAFSNCANCGACYNICPVDAITVNKEDTFYSLSVDNNKCIECGLCKKVCPVNEEQNRQNLMSAYGAVHTEKEIQKKSSSGGAFTAMADYILQSGGIVFGAAFEDQYRGVSIKSTEEVSLNDLRKSKYVESNVGLSFRDVKKYLEQKLPVLYCAAPCQIAGLHRYLGKEYENLFTCDFSCGGMSSHHFYSSYIELLEKKYGSQVTGVDFRPKTIGWDEYFMKICFKNGKKYMSSALKDLYFRAFLNKHFTIRDECCHCKFADNHYSDIVLADFWLYKKISDIKHDNSGLSLIISNSEKGERLIQAVSDKMVLNKVDTQDASYNMKKKVYSEEFMKKRKQFIDEYEKNGIVSASKYLDMPDRRAGMIISMKCLVKKLLRGIR